jgi:hypothetical protein
MNGAQANSEDEDQREANFRAALRDADQVVCYPRVSLRFTRAIFLRPLRELVVRVPPSIIRSSVEGRRLEFEESGGFGASEVRRGTGDHSGSAHFPVLWEQRLDVMKELADWLKK